MTPCTLALACSTLLLKTFPLQFVITSSTRRDPFIAKHRIAWAAVKRLCTKERETRVRR